ncbi:hypothetical protein [Ornithinibacillus californiensis]|uniref:hypothetical protein n=1 Tax=Ornithinibacillus californiensis TaxID=161536 RepID=UPI00064DB4EB|nr:hypothetical protein [Ornithinibacillus californiensis]
MGGSVRNCKLCLERMDFSAFSMCQRCLNEMEKVRSYVKKQPSSSVEEIAQAINLSIERVLKIIDFSLQRGTK